MEIVMSVSLKVWTSPKTQEVRIYANAFRERAEFAYADGAYFVADENGMTKIGGFKSCYSGNYGRAAHAIFEAFRMSGVSFGDMIARIEAAQTKGGNFSETQYFKALKVKA
jgi:hypothetical protein